MSVKIISIEITPELSTDTVDFSLGNITGKLVAEITCKAEWKALAGLQGDNEQIEFTASTSKIEWPAGNFESEGFLKGDDLLISGTTSNNGNYTIDQIDGNTIVTVEALTDEVSESVIIEGVTPITGVNFRYNLIENNVTENYNSLIDGNELKFSVGGVSDASLETPLIQQGVYKSNHLGQVTIEGGGGTNEFIISHTFFITPFFTLEELDNFLQGIAPAWLFDDAALRYIYNIELLYNLSDPNRVHKSEPDSLIGNTGWFGENFNGGLPKFEISEVTFEVAGDPTDYADFPSVTDVEITVLSEDGVFSNGNTKFVLNHFILPELQEQYKNTPSDVTTNFMFDRKLQIVGGGAVNGDNFSTPKQVLADITGTFVSPTEIKINFKIDLSTDYKARVEALTNKRFLLSVYIQDHTKQTQVSDLVATRLGTQVYSTDLSNPNVGTVSTAFNYFNDVDTDMSDAGMFVEDTLRGKTIISVDTTNGALIQDISVIIKAVKTGASFELERKNFSFSSAVIQGGVQQIDIDEERGFILGEDNPFNVISLKRRPDLDSGANKFYELIYSFKIRWEDFIKLLGVHPDFYDITKKFKGFNNDWNRYFAALGWTIKYTVNANIEETGFLNPISQDKNIFAYNYEEATDFTQEIKVFDIDTNLEIANFVISNKTVRVQAIFTKISGSLPDIDDVEGLIETEPFEQGGVNVIRNINTIYEYEDGSPFISVLGNRLLKKEKVGNVYTFTANLDGTLLTVNPKLSARIYVPIAAGNKNFQDDATFEFMDGEIYDFQN